MADTQSARPFRGRFMDMVHPSSDVSVADKANHASEQITVAPKTEPRPDVVNSAPVNTNGVSRNDNYESPFLTNVEVEKRPLGESLPTKFDLPDWIKEFSQPELPADDGGKGELEPELPAGNEPKESEQKPEEIKLPEPNHLPRQNAKQPPANDTRAALTNTMIVPQYKISETAQLTEPKSPYAHAAEEAAMKPTKKHFPVLGWILLFLLLVVAGGATGALIYLSGWLG